MSSEAITLLVSRLAMASIELFVLGGLVAALLAVFRGIHPTWRRRIWLLVLCKPLATIVTAFWGGFVPIPGIASGSLLLDVLFPLPEGSGVVGVGFVAGVMTFLAYTWLAVSFGLLIRSYVQVQASRRLVDESLEKGYRVKPSALRRMDRSLHIPPAASIIVTPEDHGPITVGIRRPVVIIPESLLPWVLRHRDPTSRERDRFCQVIQHELAHIANRDYMFSFFGHVVLSLLWFHPVAHLAYRKFRINSELCCDASVVERGADPMAYADTLMAVVAGKFARSSFAPQMVGDCRPASVLRRRLQFMLTDHEVTRRRGQTAPWVLIVLVMLAMPRFLAHVDVVDVQFADGHVEKMRIIDAKPLIETGLVALYDPAAPQPPLMFGPIDPLAAESTGQRFADSQTATVGEFVAPLTDVQLASVETEEMPEVDGAGDGERVARADDEAITVTATVEQPSRRRTSPPIRVHQPGDTPTSPLLGPPGNRR